MTDLLAELGKTLAEKWLSFLVLPGVLFVATVLTCWQLSIHGWDTAAERDALLASVDRWVTNASTSSGRVALLVIGVLLLSSGVGFAAQALGAVSRRVWLAEAPFKVMFGFATRIRRRYWRWLQRKSQCAETAEAKRQIYVERRNRLALAEPTEPTWMSDRMAGVASRVRNEYGLDLAHAWPRLWLSLDETAREDTEIVTSAFDRASVLAGWGLLYASASAIFATRCWWWWPLALIGTSTYVVGWFRGRLSIGTLATSVEAIIDVHGAQLIAPLVEDQPKLTPELGELLNERFRKGS